MKSFIKIIHLLKPGTVLILSLLILISADCQNIHKSSSKNITSTTGTANSGFEYSFFNAGAGFDLGLLDDGPAVFPDLFLKFDFGQLYSLSTGTGLPGALYINNYFHFINKPDVRYYFQIGAYALAFQDGGLAVIPGAGGIFRLGKSTHLDVFVKVIANDTESDLFPVFGGVVFLFEF